MTPTTYQSNYTMEELMWHYEQLQGNMAATTCTATAAAFVKDAAVLEELRCGYSSKRCENIRTTKKGGGLHRFCEFHRRRANKNQWRVDNKRRMMRTHSTDAPTKCEKADKPSSPTSSAPYSPQASPRMVKKAKLAIVTTQERKEMPDPVARTDDDEDETESWLSDSDIAMLQSILFDEDFFVSSEDSQKGLSVGSPTAVYDLPRPEQEWIV